MISIIITSFKEPNTIGRCIRALADIKYSGLKGEFEVIQVSPDKGTLDAGLKEAKRLKLGKRFIQITDPLKGKPYALNLAFKKSKGEILVLTDGDVYAKENALKYLLKPFENESVGGVTSRPMASDSKDTMMGYIGNLLADAADFRRRRTAKEHNGYFISSKRFFPMSGYLFAMRNVIKEIPVDLLSDDAYMSYMLRNMNLEIAYEPRAIVFVKYPDNLTDYYKQKVRSLGGYAQLKEYGVFKRDGQSRGFLTEVPHTFFALFYAKSLKQLYWSIVLHLVRLVTWYKILVKRVVKNEKIGKKGWERIESTK